MNILQKILAVVSGIAVGMIFVFAGDYGASLIVPFPKDIDMSNKQNLIRVHESCTCFGFSASC
jgi:hypothetical protein